MIQDAVTEIIASIWPTLVIIISICISFRLCYLVKNNKDIVFYRELFSLLFIIYILCLFHIVTAQDINYGSNFIPFKEMFRYELFSPKFIKNVLGNVCLFMPFGFFVSYYLKTNKIWYPLFLTALASVIIEIVQYNIGRVFDIDDIILNFLGGIFGYIIYVVIDSIRDRLPKFLQKEWFLNLILIIFIILLIYYVYGLQIIEAVV